MEGQALKEAAPVENHEGISSFVFSILLFMFFEEFSLASNACRWCICGTFGKRQKVFIHILQQVLKS